MSWKSVAQRAWQAIGWLSLTTLLVSTGAVAALFNVLGFLLGAIGTVLTALSGGEGSISQRRDDDYLYPHEEYPDELQFPDRHPTGDGFSNKHRCHDYSRELSRGRD